MYTQQRVPLFLQATDKPVSKGSNRRDFCMPICSAALNQPSAIFPEPPGLSKGLLLPNDRYELQSRQPGAPYQEPEIICTICEINNNTTFCYITLFGLFVCCLWRSHSLERSHPGDTTIWTTLYLDRHDNQNARMLVLLVYALSLARSLALHTSSSALIFYAFRCSQCGASTPHTSNAHTCNHVCNAVCQCVST